MASNLSDEMNLEILSRSSLKTLDTIRCTNKKYEKLTYEWYLLHLHKQRNDFASGFLVQNISHLNYLNEFAPSSGSKNIDLGFLPRKSRILASSEQGFMVFESPHPKKYQWSTYHICKPATKQILPLPNPKTKYLTEKVSIVVMGSKPLHYKILRLSHPVFSVLKVKRRDESYSTYRCEIFDSRTWVWRRMDLLKLPYCVFPANPQPITAGGSIYMLLSNNEILKFDAYSEEWTIFSSPIQTLQYESRQLVKHEGKLGFACKTGDECWEIWVLGIDGSWEKIYGSNEDEDINTRFDDNKLPFYRENTINEVVLTDRYYRMFVYRSDFEPTDFTVDTSR